MSEPFDFYKEELSCYNTQADGLYHKKQHIAYCEVKVAKVEAQYDLKTNTSEKRYNLYAIYPNGKKTETVQVLSLDNISCFKLWGIPEINDSGKEQKLIKKKLQLEAALLDPEKCICLHQGFQKYDGKVLWVMGDRVIGLEQIMESITIREVYPFPDVKIYKKVYVQAGNKSIISFMPGVSEILFYYSMLAIVKMVLHEVGIDTNFALAVIGPSGHLKTSMVKKIALWLSDKGRQQFTFSSYERTPRMLEMMDKLGGLNYLIDDFHAYTKTQDIERQNKRLDDIVRHIESNPDCANAIITGEHIQGIFSCIDRMFVINIPKKSANELSDLKSNLSKIPDRDMAVTAYIFAEELLNHIEEVKEDCLKFYQDNYEKSISTAENATRTLRHCCFIEMAEFLFCKYVCNKDQELSAHSGLKDAIEKQYKIQQEQLRKLSVSEQHDYVLEVKDMLDAEEDKFLIIETNPDRYENFGESCLLHNNKIYITRSALTYGMMRYYGASIDIGKIIKALEDGGVLNRGTDTLTKKFKNKRHYVIDLRLLELYSKMKGD